MSFKMPNYMHPDFSKEHFKNAPNCSYELVQKDGVSPRNYHAMSIYPEYFKINDKWVLATESRMDTVCVINDTIGEESIEIVEFRNLKKGDKVVTRRSEDGSEGIYLWTKGFLEKDKEDQDTFSFRSGRSRETSFSKDYDNLYSLLKYEKENQGHVSLVLGSSVSMDRNSRKSLKEIISNGYIDTIFCGTETVAMDLVSSMGLKINDYNIYKTISHCRKEGSIKNFVNKHTLDNSFIKEAINNNINIVIPGTIRDRYPLNETIDDVYKAQDTMRAYARKTSSLIMIGSMLYTIATGNMTPSYNKINNIIRPVYLYTIDIQEFAVNKLADRGSLTAVSIVTNSQDFLNNLNNGLK